MTYTRTKSALLERFDNAIKDMYHNATPNHPSIEESEAQSYQDWFEFTASNEIDYLSYLGMTEKEWQRQERIGFTHNERFYWLVTRMIKEFGRLYQWGRGGRTLAPEKLVRTGGGSAFSMRDGYDWDEYSNETLTYYVQIIEAFNKYVGDWNKTIPEQWEEEKKQRLEEVA